MTNKIKSMFSRLAAPFLKSTLALLAACIVGGALAADPAWLVWDAGGGDDSYFTTAANWSNDAAPSADTNASREFASASMGKTVTFNTAGESVGAIFVRNLWNKTDALTPVVFEAKDSNQSYGFVAARAFSAADMANSQSAFTIESGAYKANAWSLWAYGANSSLDAKIKGGTVSLNGGVGIAEGVGGNVTSRVDVCGGTLAIEGGDMLIGLNSDADSLAEISVSNGGVISCGENVEKWIAFGHGGSYAGTVHFNIDAGGTLKAWRIEKRSSTTTTKAKINFNGGTLATLGEMEIIGAGIDVVIGTDGGTIDVGANNVTIAATVTGTGTIIKKGSGKLTFTGDMSEFTGSIVVVEGGAVTVSETGTSATAGVGTTKTDLIFTTDGTTYSWVGGGTPNEDGSYNWTDLQNWSLNGSEPTAYPGSTGAADSQTTDVVYFPGSNTVTVKLTGNAYTKNVLLLGKVTLTGGGTLFARTISGDELTLAGATLRGYQNGKSWDNNGLAISCDLSIAESTENSLVLGRKSDNNYCVAISLSGALLGKGVLKIVEERNDVQYVSVADASGFEGTWITTSTEIADCTKFTSANQVGKTASYTFNKPRYKDFVSYPFSKEGETFYIGALNGIVYLRGNSDANARNMTLVIGSRNENCSFGGELSVTVNKNHIKKVGTASLTYTGSGFIGDLTIENGTFIIGSANSAPGKIIFTGGALSEAEGVDVDPISKFAADGSTTAAVVIDDWGYPHEWSGALTPERVPNGFTKKGCGTLTLTTTPTYTGTTTIEAGTLVIPSGTALGELSIADGAYLYVDGANGDTVTIGTFADEDTKGRVKVAADSVIEFVYDENTGKYVGTISRADLTYTWNGSVGTDWNTIGNWTVTRTEGGDSVSLTAVNITDADTIVFPLDATTTTVALPGDVAVKSVEFNKSTTLSGGLIATKSVKSATGVTVTLGNSAGFQTNGADLSIELVMVITAASETPARFYCSDDSATRKITIASSSTITGSGYLQFDTYKDHYGDPAHVINADMRQFEGHVKINSASQGAHRDNTKFGQNAYSENAYWDVENGVRNNQASPVNFFDYAGEYRYGSLTGSVKHYGNNQYTVVIGGLGENDTLGGEYYMRNRYSNGISTSGGTIRKVGTGTLTFTGALVHAFEIANGTLDINADASFQTFWDSANNNTYKTSLVNEGDEYYPTITFTGNSTLVLGESVTIDPTFHNQIAVNSSVSFAIATDSPRTFANAIGSGTTGGFTKKGAGTLTLSAAPQYTGNTAVEGGVLYIVDTYAPTLAAGTVEMVSDKAGYKKFVPASAAVAHVDGVYYATFAEAWAAAGNDDNAKWIYLDAALAQDDVVTLTAAWQKVRVANGTNSAEGHVAISGNLVNVALKTSPGAAMTEYTAYPTVAVTVTPGTGVASGVIAEGSYISKSGDVYTIYSGSEVTITWTADEGYEFAGGESTATTVISPTENVTPECPAATAVVVGSVSIAAPVVGAYGNDFATVSVTAGVTSTYPAATTITYTLKANGTAIATTTAAGDATSVTFGNANVSGLTRYDNISYTVEASGDNVTAATSGATTAMLADAEGWIDEKKSTTGTTGSWKTADGAAATVTYDDETERAELSDNKFSATNCSTGDVVTVTIKDVIYTALSDTSTVDGDAQGSIALGGTEDAPKFMVLTKSNDTVQWSEAAGVVPSLNTPYTIVFKFDYTCNTYSITVNGAALTVGGSSTYGIVKTDNKYVKDIDFLGAGSIKAIEGIRYDAMMAVDQDGVRYATVADALNANKGVKGAIIKLLHGTSNTNIAGWRFDEATMSFIKKAMGIVFLAF